MSDDNLIFAYNSIADMGTPIIIINNACVSWHRLAGDMTFAGARAYVGTLFPVTSIEASGVVKRILDAHWGKALPVALWAAQREVYEVDQGRPYVVCGVFPQRLRVQPLDYPERIRKQLSRSLAGWKKMLADVEANDGSNTKRIGAVKEIIKSYEQEFDHFNDPNLGMA